MHLPVYGVFISLESVVNRGAHAGGHGVGVGRVRVLVRVQLGPVVEVHRLHGPGAVRVSVHGGRYAHPVHPVVGQVFVLHTHTYTHMCTVTHTQRREYVKLPPNRCCEVKAGHKIYFFLKKLFKSGCFEARGGVCIMSENIVVNSPSEEGKAGSRCFNIYLDEQNSPQGFDFGSSIAENTFLNSETSCAAFTVV